MDLDLDLDLDQDKNRPWSAIDLQIESNKSFFFIKYRKFSMYTETLLEIRNINYLPILYYKGSPFLSISIKLSTGTREVF